ncbi:DUF808 domain-containing protein [Aestuariimicrobium sp. p3-SID1156]|uniref:DUF808 domain-containing protein n=1 Tax=Aestuariimicrobium sp. p3-SID1156 TaxID=2916038 RepID=UPI00223BEED1|nr:DUF808 domain-containing protein [Aestuariimicrobium sp. p3-SID1156]MCT1458978.1 DUF808 domain-containing protein [Aestuariimicrobium sp. p3-SID1156]
MAGGLAALLDDVAVIAKMTSVTGTKALGVVVDDAAVTPQYVQGFSPARELPIIAKIARGSLLNKAILIVLLLVLDHFLPVVLTPLLMLGGAYLSFEGAEKLWEALRGGHEQSEKTPAIEAGPDIEKKMVRGAITTDFILSAEIMVISLNTLNESSGGLSLTMKALTLVSVAIAITVLVYGVVALIVKLDDVGLKLAERPHEASQRLGGLMVAAMPKILTILSTVGIAAMLWVGGHILLAGTDKLGWDAPYELVHHLAAPAHHVAGLGGFLGWLVETFFSAIVGLMVGAVLVLVMHLLPIHRHGVHTTSEKTSGASH